MHRDCFNKHHSNAAGLDEYRTIFASQALDNGGEHKTWQLSTTHAMSSMYAAARQACVSYSLQCREEDEAP